MPSPKAVLSLGLAVAMLVSAVAILAPVAVNAQVPPCGTVLTLNTTLIGGTCTTPFAYTIGAPSITIRCAAANPVFTGIGTNIGIYNPGFANVHIVGCTFQSFLTGYSIVGAAGNGLLRDVATDNKGDGFNITSSTYTSLTKDKATSNGLNGFDFTSSSYSTDVSCLAESNTGNGYLLTSETHDVLEANTAVLNGANGIELAGSTLNYLISNTAAGNTNDGILLTTGPSAAGGGSTASIGNLIYHNTASLNHHDGIELIGADANTLIDNTAKFNLNDGIDLNGGSGLAGPNVMVQNLTLNNVTFNRSDSSVGPDSDGTSNWWIVDNAVPPATTFPLPYLP